MTRHLYRIVLSAACFFLGIGFSFAADLRYPVSSIPQELKDNVSAVVREYSMNYRIFSVTRTTLDVHFVVTILNEKGKHFATQVIFYDKMSKITSIEGVVYDATGKQVKKLKNSEIYDQSAYDGISLFNDDRLKAVSLEYGSYPYTVDVSYSQEGKSTLGMPSCYVFGIPGTSYIGEEHSVEHLRYQLVFPAGLEPRYRVINLADGNPRRELTGDGQELIWELKNVKPIKFESAGPLRSESSPQILLAPNEFDYDGFAGSMTQWKEFGKWNYMLNKDRDVLPASTRAKVRQLTQGLKTDEEKAKVLYEYLQSKSRYVSIQVGIGGWQPFPATLVDEKGYGDCKALSNYMVALLKEAGVKAYYVIIKAGRDEGDIITEFPSLQMNHVIAAMITGKDTVWMECTSQTIPFGYLSGFTADKHAVMVTEDGGKIVKTPVYTPEQNKRTRSAHVFVAGDGSARAEVNTTYQAEQLDPLEGMIHAGTDDQKKWIEENTDIPTFSINNFGVKTKPGKIPSATLKLNMTLSRYASVSGKRMFITPNLMSRIPALYQPADDRKAPVVRKNNYIHQDTISFHIPENLYPEFLPQPVKISSRFGEYEASYQFKDGIVVYTRRMKTWKGNFPKESYNELVEFYKNVNKADNSKLVFLNKT